MMNWLKHNLVRVAIFLLFLTGFVYLFSARANKAATLSLTATNFLTTTSPSYSPTCPYGSLVEFTDGDFKSFIGFYFTQRPGASSDEADNAVKQLIISKGCNEIFTELERGLQKRDASGPKLYESVGSRFSFQYPSHLFVQTYPDQLGWIVVSPKLEEVDDKEPMTAIIVTEALDRPEMTAEQWLNGPNSGYSSSRDGRYTYRKVGGQEAVITADDWVVVKSPDGKRRISITFLVEEEKDAEPLYAALKIILDTFAFK